MKRRSSYKVTLFDKYGPEALNRLRALGYAAMVFGLSLAMFFVLGSRRLGFGGLGLIVFTLLGALTLSGLSMYVGLRTGAAAGHGASHVYMGGSSTPHEDSFSVEQALVMQRDYAGALHLYEQRILVTPTDVRVLVAAADLYATHGANAIRAAELYREVQKLPKVPSGQDIYVSNKLADLYLGPLKEPGRALVEFRRLIHRYPGSVAEKHARMALANLKPDLVKEQGSTPDS
jgi:hypothetical protein